MVNGKAGTTYLTETSADFTNWVAISTNPATADRFIWTDVSATNHMEFYRVRVSQ